MLLLVVFVVDTCRVKENRYDNLNKIPTLVECWVSKSSAKQRRGRAGRVKPGYCWHLYSTHTHEKEIDDHQLPEMLRVGLEDLGERSMIAHNLDLMIKYPSLFSLCCRSPSNPSTRSWGTFYVS